MEHQVVGISGQILLNARFANKIFLKLKDLYVRVLYKYPVFPLISFPHSCLILKLEGAALIVGKPLNKGGT